MGLDNLLVQLGLNTRGYDAGLQKSKDLTGRFASGIKAQLASAFTVGAAISFFKTIEQGATRIKDLSEQFNITTDEVQQFDFHAKKSGLSMETFTASLARLADVRRDASKGDLKAIALLNEFGISLADAKSSSFSMADAVKAVGGSVKEFGVDAQRGAQLTDLLGKSGQRLITTLKSIGDVPPFKIDEKDIETIDKASKSWEVLWSRMKAGATEAIARIMRFEGPRAGSVNFGRTDEEIDRYEAAKLTTKSIQTPQQLSGIAGPTFVNRDLESKGINKGLDQHMGRLIKIEEDSKRILEEIAHRGINLGGF